MPRSAAGSGTQLLPACAPDFALALIIDVEESLVFDDRAAERTAELVVVEWVLVLRSEVEVVAGSPLSLRKYSSAEPCNWLVPLLVTMLTTAPLLRPYSAS